MKRAAYQIPCDENQKNRTLTKQIWEFKPWHSKKQLVNDMKYLQTGWYSQISAQASLPLAKKS